MTRSRRVFQALDEDIDSIFNDNINASFSDLGIEPEEIHCLIKRTLGILMADRS
jgi:hypothetical protein